MPERKPLELTIWPTWEAIDGALYADCGDQLHPKHVDFEVHRKRFKPAELAAECWFFDMTDFCWPADPDELTDEEWEEWRAHRAEANAALHRFATHDHYDQEDQ